MNIEHLPVHYTERSQVLFPLKISREEKMTKCEQHQQYSNDFKMNVHSDHGLHVKTDINGVHFFSSKEWNPAFSNASRQTARGKKCVKPAVNAIKLGRSRRCSTIITLPTGLQMRRH